MRIPILCIALFLCSAGLCAGQPLRTGLIVYPPFGQQDDTGICPEIWSEIARDTGLSYTLQPYTDVQNALEAVASGDLDLAIGPISITAQRLETVAFTLPYYRASIGLLIPSEPETLWDRTKPFFRTAALSSIGLLLFALFIVGNLVWLAERRANPAHFPPEYAPGIGNGIWFALVTLTTVGYGDRVPITPKGRLISGIWMVLSMIIASSLIAGLASAFTLSLSSISTEKFASLNDIAGKRVAAVAGTTSAAWAAHYGARSVETGTLEEAVGLLAEGRAEAIAFGQPLLRHYLKHHPEHPFALSHLILATEDYGFALPIDSPHLHPINQALKEMEERGRIQTITEAWLD